MTDGGDIEDIRLTIPALPEYGRLARQCAAGLGLRRRLGFRALEDLQLAVDETIIALLDDAPEAGRLRLVFHVSEGQIGLDAAVHRADGAARPVTDDGAARFELFAGDLVDSHRIDIDEGVISFVKRVPTPA